MIYINILSILIYLISCAFIVRKQNKYTTLFGFVSFTQIWTLISCFYNDLGIYNFELQNFTEPSYATTRLALFYVVFNIGFLLVAQLIGTRSLLKNDYSFKKGLFHFRNIGNFRLLSYIICTGVIIYIFQSLNKIPLFEGIDRASYLESAGPVQITLMTWGHFIAFGLGLIRKQDRFFSFPMILFIAIFIFSILIGNKFSYPSNLIVYFYTPTIMRFATKNIRWNPLQAKNFLYLAAACIVFISFAFVKYYDKLESIEGAQILIMDRVLGNQGQMWWAIDQQLSSSDNDQFRSHWNNELERILDTDEIPIQNAGMMYLMIKILGPEVAFAKLDAGYLFTMAYPAILVVTFPYTLAILIQFIVGCLFFIILYYIYNCVIYKHYFRALITFLILKPFIAVLFSGNFHVFFTVGMVIKISILVIMEIYPQLYRTRLIPSIEKIQDRKYSFQATELPAIDDHEEESK